MKRFIILGLFILINFQYSFSQYWDIVEMAPMPMAISNNAVTQATVNGVMHVFSFAGIDSTKIWSGITNKSFRYNVVTDTWDTIASLPDINTKIAAGASTVNNKIYIIGGYTVLSNGNEISSNKVHIYDADSNVYLQNGTDIPIAIDDHVQAVWRDSLIFVITGWSNSTNRPEVQIYNPSNDSWSSGTSVPNNNIYKSFGASGVIIGDTIYYYGGASLSGAFNIQNNLRMGIINPSDPTQVSWTNPINFTGEPGYRCAATTNYKRFVWFIGGSKTTYNFNGIAYNGTGGVPPANRSLFLETSNLLNWFPSGVQVPMDLRGIAEIDNTLPSIQRIIAGGMTANQTVSNKTLLLSLVFTPGIEETELNTINVFPNPADEIIYLPDEFIFDIKDLIIRDMSGREVSYLIRIENEKEINISTLPVGIYALHIVTEDAIYFAKFGKL